MSALSVRFLGTNGWYDTETGNTVCMLIDAVEAYVILDAGNGIRKIDRFIKEDKPAFLFISHLHLDHIIGLHIMAKFNFPRGLTICVPGGKKKLLESFAGSEFTLALNKLQYKVEIVELDGKSAKIPFLEKALLLKHPVPCLGFRFNFGGKVVSYVADTGPCENADLLAQNADLVIAECAFKTGQKMEIWPHMTPQADAELARKGGAKRLIMTHFDAEVYPAIEDRRRAEAEAKKIFPNTIAATDDLEVEV